MNMEPGVKQRKYEPRITFRGMATPAKALATCIILTMTLGMLGALGQIVIHDIIPTFFASNTHVEMTPEPASNDGTSMDPSKSDDNGNRGDLFSDLSPDKITPKKKAFYRNEQFVWTLKWTHIHLFGMSMIFIFMGAVALFLDTSASLRTGLIVLPFFGVLIDISAMWLKAFISPVFFWLHIPGGGLFVAIFFYVSLRALREMWIKPLGK